MGVRTYQSRMQFSKWYNNTSHTEYCPACNVAGRCPKRDGIESTLPTPLGFTRNLTDTAEQNTTLGHLTIEKPLQHPPRSPGCALRAQPTGSEARTTWKARASPRATALPARPAGPLLTARRNRRQGSQPSILVKASGGQGLG